MSLRKKMARLERAINALVPGTSVSHILCHAAAKRGLDFRLPHGHAGFHFHVAPLHSLAAFPCNPARHSVMDELKAPAPVRVTVKNVRKRINF